MQYQAKNLILGIIGIYILFILTSYYTEKIFSTQYKHFRKDKSKVENLFKCPALITWSGCLVCCFFGYIYSKLISERTNPIASIEGKKLGLLFVFSILPSNYSLLYISFPLQVIARTTKYFCVIFFGIFFSRIQQNRELKIPKSKIVIASILTFSTIVFVYQESIRTSNYPEIKAQNKWLGLGFLVVAIIADSLYIDYLSYCKVTYKPTPNHIFLIINFYAFLIIFIGSFISGTLFPSLKFCITHPSVFWDLFFLIVLQLATQLISIYLITTKFKQYVYPLINSTKTIVVVVISTIVFGHNLSISQWIAVFFIAVALFAELADEVTSREQNQQIKRKSLESQSENDELDKQIKQESKIKNLLRQSSRYLPSQKEHPSQYMYKWRLNEIADSKDHHSS